MIDIEQQEGLVIRAPEPLEDALLPAFRQVGLGIHIFGKETAFVRNAEEIEDRSNHLQMRNQNRLSKIFRELLVTLANTRPEARGRLAQMFRVQFGKARPRFETIVKLVRFQFANRDPADEAAEVFFPRLQQHVRKLHKRSGYHSAIKCLGLDSCTTS